MRRSISTSRTRRPWRSGSCRRTVWFRSRVSGLGCRVMKTRHPRLFFMALTKGTGPFGEHPGGVWNREMPPYKGLIYFEDSPRRIRAEFAGETIVDSTHAKLLHEAGLLPVYYFPEDEIRTDLM